MTAPSVADAALQGLALYEAAERNDHEALAVLTTIEGLCGLLGLTGALLAGAARIRGLTEAELIGALRGEWLAMREAES